ncbi:MAG: hypothetical protein ROZ37_07740 [Aromatoleum sp.]|jgi:hypothetical protein|uniref:hypothetical protein n=1 Tax=Aromatoleum sp. TaxID=2307007 RepID=UPI002894FC42|nr:hypothetical protein [Aromatoleum sp.]MDT3670211.1 hypothetical protein [Aromatoleum sp.]
MVKLFIVGAVCAGLGLLEFIDAGGTRSSTAFSGPQGCRAGGAHCEGLVIAGDVSVHRVFAAASGH